MACMYVCMCVCLFLCVCLCVYVYVCVCFIPFIHYGDLYSAPSGYYSEALPTLARLKRRVLRV